MVTDFMRYSHKITISYGCWFHAKLQVWLLSVPAPLGGSSVISRAPESLSLEMMMTAGFTSLTMMASTTWPFLPSDRSLRDIMMSVRRGQQVKRGRCGSSNMANMFQRKCLLQYLTGWDFMRYLKMKFTSLQKYICTSFCYCLCAEIVSRLLYFCWSWGCLACIPFDHYIS